MTSRSWTDEELTAVVATARSWRGVCRGLGLKATSAAMLRSVRRHAERLQLDTTHFTHQRMWSDAALRSAISTNSTWAGVVESLGLAESGDSRARVKGHAVRLGLDVTHLQPRVSKPARDDLHDLHPTRDRLRAAAESIATTWFTLRGIPVAMPTVPTAYDLLVTIASSVSRVQVKSGTRATAAGGYVVTVGHRPYSTERRGNLVPYDPDDLDFFFIVEGGGGLLLIPITAIAGRTMIDTAAHSAYRVGDASSLLAEAA